MHDETPEPSFGERMMVAIDAIGELVERHVALAAAELSRDARRVGADLVPLVVALPLLVCGWALLCAAAAAAMAPWLGAAWSLAAVGAANLAAGGGGAVIGVRRLQRPGHATLTVGAALVETASVLTDEVPRA
jgi:hypothetical protein